MIGLDLFQHTVPLQLLRNLLSAREPVLALVVAGVLVHGAVGVHDVYDGQAMPLADLEVGGVVARCDLHSPGAELGVNGRVGDNRHHPLQNGNDHVLANVFCVAVIVGVNGDGCVSQQGLRPGGSDSDGAPLPSSKG